MGSCRAQSSAGRSGDFPQVKPCPTSGRRRPCPRGYLILPRRPSSLASPKVSQPGHLGRPSSVYLLMVLLWFLGGTLSVPLVGRFTSRMGDAQRPRRRTVFVPLREATTRGQAQLEGCGPTVPARRNSADRTRGLQPTDGLLNALESRFPLADELRVVRVVGCRLVRDAPAKTDCSVLPGTEVDRNRVRVSSCLSHVHEHQSFVGRQRRVHSERERLAYEACAQSGPPP